jgi:outer membrane cobalamin receptor
MGGMRMLWSSSPKWSFAPSLQYIGSRQKGPFDPGPDTIDEAWLLGLQGQWTLFDRLSLSGSLMNALNAPYTEVPGYNTAGRTANIHVTYNF